jgi:ATP dependent DNA ligase domain
MQRHEAKARFVPPMLLQRTASLPEGPEWSYKVELDVYRVLAVKTDGKVLLRSRNNKDFNSKYPGVARALGTLPDETVIDGEIVALDESGRPSFNALQNVGSSKTTLVYYVFDVLVLAGKNVMTEELSTRRQILQSQVLPKLNEPVRESPQLNASLPDLVKAVRTHGFEGIVAKRLDSRYEPGQRSGAWRKMRVNQGQEFVIGGYTPGPRNFDAFGYYESGKLLYAARTGNGFTPASRTELYLGNPRMPVFQPAGASGRPLGAGPRRREDEGVPLAGAGARGPVRVRGVDSGRPPAALEVHCPPRGQGPEGGGPGGSVNSRVGARLRADMEIVADWSVRKDRTQKQHRKILVSWKGGRAK